MDCDTPKEHRDVIEMQMYVTKVDLRKFMNLWG